MPSIGDVNFWLFFFFGRKGFCCSASILVYMMALEKRQVKSTMLRLKDSSPQDTKSLWQSSNWEWVVGGWTQSKTPLETITYSPLILNFRALEFWEADQTCISHCTISSGLLQYFFLFPETVEFCPESLHIHIVR